MKPRAQGSLLGIKHGNKAEASLLPQTLCLTPHLDFTWRMALEQLLPAGKRNSPTPGKPGARKVAFYLSPKPTVLSDTCKHQLSSYSNEINPN